MSHPTLRDADLARLPLDAARDDLFAAITATPVEVAHRVAPPHRRTPWLPVAASVAAVLAIAAVPVWHATRDGGVRPTEAAIASASPTPTPTPTPTPGPTPTPAPALGVTTDAPSVPGGTYVALNAGWAITYASEGNGEIDSRYANGTQELELVQYPASTYQSYYDDRMHVSAPTSLQVLGRSATMWAYNRHDHAAIRVAEGAHFLEARGSGMDEATFRALLGRLVQTDAKGFAGTLPDDVVTPYNRDAAIARLLAGVRVPPGFTAADVDLEGFNDAYQSASRVAGSVGCAWLSRWPGASAATRDEVLAAFDGSRQWPLLQRIADESQYASVFWGIADELRAGQPAVPLRGSIC